ncbi:hypothetical protein JCM10908_006155 [Rhodotorula pacifica]|uniref:uncharacterized protein n=1 Tax=Rhodotorula pacifica TaxID=1495444 RepID=UPI00317ACD2F
MRRRSSIALPNFGNRRASNASAASSVKEEIVKDIFHVGLVNLGNSCFYNTIVQSLSATQPLGDIIAEAPDSSPALRALSPSSSDYNPDLDALPSPLPMTAALLVLLDKLDPTAKSEGAVAMGKKAFNPKSLLRQLSLKHDEYAEATQQDSHECLRHLIDGVMMEEQDLIKKIVEATPDHHSHRPGMPSRNATVRPAADATRDSHSPLTPNAATPTDGQNGMLPLPADSTASTIEDESGNESDTSSSGASSSSSSSSEDEDESLDSDVDERRLTLRQRKKRALRPFVGSIFEGKLASFIICDECKNVSLTKEDFMDLSLSLRDDTGNKMRKRDRIRRTLQAGFFGRKSGKASSGDDSKAGSDASVKKAPNGVGRDRASQSETDGSASASEADETDEDHIRPAGLRAHADLDGSHATSVRSRINSLDPAKLSREGGKPHASSLPVPAHSSRDRDPSPLGRAISILSQGSHGEGHGHHHLFHRRPKIPKPTPEQVSYIKKVLVDIPGPASASNPSLAGLRVAHPPGSRPSSSGTDAGAVSDGASSAASSLSQLNLNGQSPAPRPAVSWQDTDLFECFRQFTSVEVLEGENSFACQNCWKWLNPELEAKRKADKAQRRAEREERRRVSRAIRNGEDPHAVATPCASDREHPTDDEDERDPADRTARNTPSHSPRLGSTFTPLAAIPPIEPLDGSKTVVAEPAPLSPSAPAASATTGANGVPMRHFSISSVATSNSEAPSVSTDYEAGISSEAFETTTDEGEDGYESESSPGLDDGASLNGSLSGLPGSNGTPLTSSALNAQQAQEQQQPGQPMNRTISEAVSESLQAQIKPLPPPDGGPPKITAKAIKSPSSAAAVANGSGMTSSASLTKPPPRKQRHILRRAHKRYLISPADLPPVLVVHLKRFMQTSKSSLFGSAFVNLKKRDDPVSFPKEMDLTPFLAPSGKPPRLNPNAFGADERGRAREAVNGHANGNGTHPHKVELEKEVHNARYRLYAAVVHFGDLNTGHYASYVLSNRYGKGEHAGRGERRWVFCSDEDVTAVSEAEVLRSKAYMLFYERVDAKTGQVSNSAIPSNTADVDVVPLRNGTGESMSACSALAPSSSTTTATTAPAAPTVLGGDRPPVAEPMSVEERVPATVPE